MTQVVDSVNHAALFSASSSPNQCARGFQLVKIWATISKLLILNAKPAIMALVEPLVIEKLRSIPQRTSPLVCLRPTSRHSSLGETPG